MKISYQNIKDILTPKEMKNVLGGSSCMVKCSDNSVHILNCASLSDCEEQCWEKCGGGGWGISCD